MIEHEHEHNRAPVLTGAVLTRGIHHADMGILLGIQFVNAGLGWYETTKAGTLGLPSTMLRVFP